MALGNCRDRPRPVGFDVTDWLGGGAADGAGFGVVELDRQRGVGHGDGEGLPGVGAAEGDLLAADFDDAGGAGPALHPDGLGDVYKRQVLPAV